MRKIAAAWLLLFLSFGACALAEEPSPLSDDPHLSPDYLSELSELHLQADNCIAMNQFDKALRIYEDIILIEPDDEVAYTQMGRIYMGLGNLEEAENAFKNALHINPENETAAMGLKRIYDPDGAPLFDIADNTAPDVTLPDTVAPEPATTAPPPAPAVIAAPPAPATPPAPAAKPTKKSAAKSKPSKAAAKTVPAQKSPEKPVRRLLKTVPAETKKK